MRKKQISELACLLGSEIEDASEVLGYQIDSRLVGERDLFFALKGDRVDGHHFLDEVAARGAVGAVVSQEYLGDSYGLTLIKVPDVLLALQNLAKKLFEIHPVRIIGITGSVGKTTTKEFLATLLETSFSFGKSPASYNSQITFPLNLLNRSIDQELLILEMGMSSRGNLARLVQIAHPEIGLLTEVALAHAEHFPEGLLGIAHAKAELFSHPATQCAILDLELLHKYPDLSLPKEKITISTKDPNADFYLCFSEERFQIDERGIRASQLDFPFKERHLIQNALLAIGAARRLGIPWEVIEQRVPILCPPKMRFEQFEKEGIWFVNDAYNANPLSMKAALENLPQPKEGGKKIAVLATMKELGSFSLSAHEEVGRFAQTHVDLLLVLGEEAYPIYLAFLDSKKPAEFFIDQKQLTQRLFELMCPGDVVLLKGSRSMQLEKIIESDLWKSTHASSSH